LELLAGKDFAGRVPSASSYLFQVDERAVPPDDPQSNYKMMREALLDRVPAAREHFHRMQAESQDLESAADAYSGEIRQAVPVQGPWPRFDFIQLGMGSNGHTASLFPASEGLHEQRRWVFPNYVPELETWGMTLTYPVINADSEIIFQVAGEDKAETMRRVLHPTSPQDRFPAQGIQPGEGTLRWYLDRAAARRL